MKRLLPAAFYARETELVARELLGKVLFVRDRGRVLGGRIVETEAYGGDDPASHSSRGATPRSAIMFGPPGFAYVYFVYGMHCMLNFVTEPEGRAGAVLIRALEPLLGRTLMSRRRAGAPPGRLTNGPGRLCRALGLTLKDNGASLRGPRLAVYDDGLRPSAVRTSPRVGITKGTETLWRFFIDGHPDVSRAPENRRSRLLGANKGG